MPQLLTENDIISAVEAAFTAKGFRLVSKCTTHQRGIDLRCLDPQTGEEWLIEAKGGTSATSSTSRFEMPFDASQVAVHVSRAIYQAMALRASHPGKRIALAFPDEERHRKRVTAIGDALERLAIDVIWVAPGGEVSLPHK